MDLLFLSGNPYGNLFFEPEQESASPFAVDHFDKQRAIAMVAKIEAVEVLDVEARKIQSGFREYLARLSPKIRKAEVAARRRLPDEVLCSPWLIGGCWPENAATMRRLCLRSLLGAI